MPRHLVLLLSVCLLSACGEPSHHDHGSGTSTDLVTDDGQKWPMDDHTRAMFSEMVNRTAQFDGDEHQLGRAMQGDLNKLIEGCNMTGAAHNELHKFLGLYMPAVQQLSESGSPAARARVEELLHVYPRYFE